MRFAPLAVIVLIVPALALLPACKRREEAPPPPAAPVTPWTDVDSSETAKQFVEAALRDPWSSQFRDRIGRGARLRLGAIEDRSGRSLPIDSISAALAQAIAQGGGDRLALAGEQADVVVGGAIGSSDGPGPDGARTTFFAIDLALTDAASGEKVWHFAVERPITAR